MERQGAPVGSLFSLSSGYLASRMNWVAVPTEEAAVFTRTIELFDRDLGINASEDLRLGGGTSLAMIWKHRRSTDFDFAMPRELLTERLRVGHQALGEVLKNLKQRGLIRKWRVWGAGLKWVWRNGCEVSISHLKQERTTPTHAESTTGTPLSPIEDVLRGKLIGCVLTNNKLVVRDAYDLMVAHREEPELFQRLIHEALENTDNLSALVQHIKSNKNRIIVGRPLLEPDDPKLAHDPWGHFAEVVGQMIEIGEHEQTPTPPAKKKPGLER